MTIQDGAGISVNSQGTGEGGNIQIRAGTLTLDNKAFITTETASDTGGNIRLGDLELLLSRGNSRISATASTGGDGGNININTDFLVALKNSDITANAFEGSGGRVNITAQGIFGTQFREQQTRQSDITASSEFGVSGVVELNTPDVDPNQGVVALPEDVVDVSGLVAQNCAAGGRTAASRASKFVVTRRSRVPPNPGKLPDSDTVLANWVTLDPEMDNRSSAAHRMNQTSPTLVPLVEAQG